ncbi:MAG: electron transfer flavoprotein subunit alpha/FixB family protein [Chloroflexota bacterium]|nr:MAG: electron transfer flavoprotein subunit alpha/FixB family protein [Chloroflexota bacterium]
MSNDILVNIEHIRGEVAEISYVMCAAAHQLSQATGGEVYGVLLGSGAENLAKGLAADKILYVDDPRVANFTSEAYQQTLQNILNEHEPRAMLFGHTSIGMEIANILSAKTGLPLISSCLYFSNGSSPKFTSLLYGGKILAQGELPSTTCLITMVPGGYKPEDGHSSKESTVLNTAPPIFDESRMSLVKYIEPDSSDVDIASEPLLIAIGRGIQLEDNIEIAEELAEAIGGIVCASRPVVDQGWLPTSRLVGKSGFRVKPKVYLALGISGAPEHVEGITGSEIIIAVNTDPAAPIFNIAKYGVVEDIFDLIPALTEKLSES